MSVGRGRFGRAALVDAVVWGGFAVLPVVLGDWQTGQLAVFFVYGLFAMSLALIWGNAGCYASARRCSSASAPMP